MREFSAESKAWLASYHGSIDSTALLLAFEAGRASAQTQRSEGDPASLLILFG